MVLNCWLERRIACASEVLASAVPETELEVRPVGMDTPTAGTTPNTTSYYVPQPAGFGAEPGTGSGMTVSVLGVASYLRGCTKWGCKVFRFGILT